MVWNLEAGIRNPGPSWILLRRASDGWPSTVLSKVLGPWQRLFFTITRHKKCFKAYETFVPVWLIWPHSVPETCKGGTRLRSGMRSVAELTGTGGECVSIVNNAPKWLVRTRAHKKLRVIPVKWLPCKRGTKLDFVPEWNSYRYHVNTP